MVDVGTEAQYNVSGYRGWGGTGAGTGTEGDREGGGWVLGTINSSQYPEVKTVITEAGYLNVSEMLTTAVADGTSAMHLAEAIVFALFTSLCICATIVGNILVILSVFTYRPLKSVQNFFIVSLATADLAVAILVMPFNVANSVIGQWVFEEIFCNMWLTFDILTCTASILNLCAIALDRYYAIHDPIRYATKRTLKRVLIKIAVVWAASAIISIPPLLGWNNRSGGSLYKEQSKICRLNNQKSFVVYSASGSFFIPLFIMTFVYVKIFLATRKRLRARAKAASVAKMQSMTGKGVACTSPDTRITPPDVSSTDSPDEETYDPTQQDFQAYCNHNDQQDDPAAGVPCITNGMGKNGSKTKLTAKPKKTKAKNNNSSNQVRQFYEEKQRISLSKERRAARTMGIIMGVFVLCWLPFFLMYVIFAFCSSCEETTNERVINFIVWLGYINSSLNPIIYTIFNIDFRRAFKSLLQGKCRT